MIRKGLSKGGVRDEEGMYNQDRAVSLAGACGTYEKEEIRRTNWMLEGRYCCCWGGRCLPIIAG
jgi:hypothetical protein